jgi:hypothetical protein
MSDTITLDEEDVSEIDAFIKEMWDAGKSTKMGNGSFDDFKQAYRKGKGSEVALRETLSDKGVDTSVDFEVYSGTDDTDLKPLAVEVKQCPHYGKWVAIPDNKFQLIEDGAPIVQVKTHSSTEFEIAGWCKQKDTFIIEEGEKPFTQYGDNHCQRIANLRDDWDDFVDYASDGELSTDSEEPKFSFSAT